MEVFAFGASVTSDHTFNQVFRRPLIFVPATVTFDRITLIYHSHFMARIWMTRATRVRSSVWRVSSKRPGGDVEKWIDVIRIGLEDITVNDANKSFNGVCSRLEDMLDSLSTLLSENSVLNKDELLQLAFAAIQLVNSVFCSMNQNQKEQSRHIMSRWVQVNLYGIVQYVNLIEVAIGYTIAASINLMILLQELVLMRLILRKTLHQR
ncbi:uncharacterized protein LOC110884353 isoform X2 [Helianthus annuus]|uniref:uncharacterized protein LOC110884353 isoform X2 n=1 Tax=Helianthus annuus TaxID=4232 RepID=UPI000B906383|nr:uncharacterized protein LOC110884353 isoform X2 [Helianthus annuus]XP_035834444.1 uncharacterized protein LOC110884353 isoform X2 [Helianthus annuus]XP_035834445.1 uncharacterized protein LOC110884353 isoform X2 [Helianthus annuus]